MDEWIRYGDMWMGRLYLFGCIVNLFKRWIVVCVTWFVRTFSALREVRPWCMNNGKVGSVT